MIVGRAVATIELSTAGMKIAISAAASTGPRRGTTTAGRASSTAAWSKPRPLPKNQATLGARGAANNPAIGRRLAAAKDPQRRSV
jgi:hypothetical protein